MSDKSRIVAVVPMKPLAESKTRLTGYLSPTQRATLSQSMFSWVLSTLAQSRVSRIVVVGGDDVVKSATLREGAEWVQDKFLDLNKAIEYVFGIVWKERRSAAYVPADLPLLASSDVNGAIEASADGRFLTLCRAHDGGTNCLILPPHTGFRLRLGPDSFRRHVELADELELDWRRHHSEGFQHDVDTISDLRYCMEKQPPCLKDITDVIKNVNL